MRLDLREIIEVPGKRIGFDRDIEMTSGHSKQSHGLRAIPGGAKMHHEAKMDEHTAREWAAMLENEDGTKGPHWSMEQVKKVIEQRGMPGDPVEIWVAMNMMYSDYCKVAKRLGVNCIATEFDREYGVYLNNMMYAKEKAKYIIDHGFPMIENFYSDSLADTPLALCAEKAHLVTNKASTVIDWPDLDEETMGKVKKKIDTGWNIHLKEEE